MKKYFSGNYFSDSALMFEYLSELEMYTGNERSGTKFFNKEPGSKKPNSLKLGHTWRKRRGIKEREYDEKVGLYKTKMLEEQPWLWNMFKEYQLLYFPNFEWTEITINHMPTGCRTKEHLDKINVGESVLIAFGNYTGGKTYIQNKNDRNYAVEDARDEPLIFNGAERKHGVTTISSGDRFSLVYYKNKPLKVKKY